jgi:hypothetical protein
MVVLTKQKIEKIIAAAFGEWTPPCRDAAKQISDLIESPGKVMASLRKTKSGGRNGGRPKGSKNVE